MSGLNSQENGGQIHMASAVGQIMHKQHFHVGTLCELGRRHVVLPVALPIELAPALFLRRLGLHTTIRSLCAGLSSAGLMGQNSTSFTLCLFASYILFLIYYLSASHMYSKCVGLMNEKIASLLPSVSLTSPVSHHLDCVSCGQFRFRFTGRMKCREDRLSARD